VRGAGEGERERASERGGLRGTKGEND